MYLYPQWQNFATCAETIVRQGSSYDHTKGVSIQLGLAVGIAEGKIDARTNILASLRQLMQPVVLHGCTHQQQAVVF